MRRFSLLMLVMVVVMLALVLSPAAMVAADEGATSPVVVMVQDADGEIVETPEGETLIIRILDENGVFDNPWSALLLSIIVIALAVVAVRYADDLQKSIPEQLYKAGEAALFEGAYDIARRTPGDWDDNLLIAEAGKRGLALVKDDDLERGDVQPDG